MCSVSMGAKFAPMADLKVNEIFYSIQGESTLAGSPCVFVRLTECNLRCTWCDTAYAFHEGTHMSFAKIHEEIAQYNTNLVEITGGEPLMQADTIDLMESLLHKNYRVMLETGGSLPVSSVPKDVIKIVDFKAPGSGMEKKNLWSILDELEPHDEIKFVLTDRTDYDWAKLQVTNRNLAENNTVLFSPVHGQLENQALAKWILDDHLPVRQQVQIHKIIWDIERRGV